MIAGGMVLQRYGRINRRHLQTQSDRHSFINRMFSLKRLDIQGVAHGAYKKMLRSRIIFQ